MVALVELYDFEEFIRLDLDEECEYELINGAIVPISEPSGAHESLLSKLMTRLIIEEERANLDLEIHPKISCKLGSKDSRKPDLIVADRTFWIKHTEVEAVLREPPRIAIEIVSSNWEDDYRNKPLWYAAFGVLEYWIIDPLYIVARYPNRRNPKIEVPTISIGQLMPSDSILVENEYRFKSYTGSDRIKSKFFPELELTVDQIVAFGKR